jgi:hypothetical protein
MWVANFGELRKVEIQLPRISIPRTPVSKGKKRAGAMTDPGPLSAISSKHSFVVGAASATGRPRVAQAAPTALTLAREPGSPEVHRSRLWWAVAPKEPGGPAIQR